jgi:hypothetical protein
MESVNLPYYIRAERYDVLHDGGNVQPYSDLCVCVERTNRIGIRPTSLEMCEKQWKT